MGRLLLLNMFMGFLQRNNEPKTFIIPNGVSLVYILGAPMQRVADYVADFCVKTGVNNVFLVSGGGIMHLLDGLVCNKDIKITCAHHEQAAAIMANAYARVTNNLGIVFVTTGPGATNAITGAVDAWVDSIPLLVISGQTKRSQNVYNSGFPELRSLGGQEVNILPIVKSFTKYSAMVNDPDHIRYHLEKAVYAARSGRPGPVWLDIPLDVQSAIIDPNSLRSYQIPTTTIFDEPILTAAIRKAAGLLNQSERPVIIAGHGIRLAHAEQDFIKLISELEVPVVVSKLGQDIIPYDNKYLVGFGGTKGTRPANFAMQNADLILSIGCRLAIPFTGYEYNLFGRDAKKIVVDIDPWELIKGTVTYDMPICSDAKRFICGFRDAISDLKTTSTVDHSKWVSKCQYWKQKYPVITTDIKCKINPVCSYNLFDELSNRLSSKSIIIADAGTSYCILSQVHRVKEGQRVITPAALGTMGFSLPLSIGAYYANTDNTIVAVTGDGSLQMNIQELQTVVHNKIPIKLFVINNNGYASIRNTQNSYFNGRFCGSDPNSGVSCPNLEKIAGAYGIQYFEIHTQSGMSCELDHVFDCKEPVICEVFTDPDQQIIPSISSRVLPDGKMVSMPLEDMYPFLPRAEFKNEMIVPICRCSDD